jgi:mevalonate kinase
MPRSVTSAGFGKVIISGEHAVIAGYPALAMAIDRTTSVTFTACNTASILPHGDDNLISALREVVPTHNVSVTISSNIPIGCGLGSSAALSVALIRTAAAWRNEDLSAELLFSRAKNLETRFHNTPSGLDNATSAMGGFITFRNTSPPQITSCNPPPWGVVIINSHIQASTSEMIAAAAQHPDRDTLFRAIGELTEEVHKHLADIEHIGPLLTQNHALLQKLGVSNETLDDYVHRALSAGAVGAKLSGSGGGGVVIALSSNAENLASTLRAQKLDAFACTGTGGLS